MVTLTEGRRKVRYARSGRMKQEKLTKDFCKNTNLIKLLALVTVVSQSHKSQLKLFVRLIR